MVDSKLLEFSRRVRRDYCSDGREWKARRVVNSVLVGWLEEKNQFLLSCLSIKPTNSVKRISGYCSVVAELAKMDSVESAYLISSLYALLIDQEERTRSGLYFTPPTLSRRVIEEISRISGGSLAGLRIIDPCSGGGAFLAPLAAYLRNEMKASGVRPADRLRRISKMISGVDVCDTLVDLSKVFCLFELSSEIERAKQYPRFDIKKKDFLTQCTQTQNFDVVLGNPPFRRLSAGERSSYADTFQQSRNGGSNLYGMFIQKSLSITSPGGTVCLIIPASLFAGKRFEHLRELIRQKADVVSIEIMQERKGVFINVQQETAVLTLRTLSSDIRRKSRASVTSISRSASPTRIGTCTIPLGKSPWVIPRKRNHIHASRLFSSRLPRISDYGLTVRTGTVVWNRDKRPRFSTVNSELPSDLSCYPLVWSDCIGKDGTFDFERARQRDPNGLFVGANDADPELLKISAIAVKRTSNSRQSRRIYCAHINSQFVLKYGAYFAENHVNLIFPGKGKSAVDLALLTRILNSVSVDRAFRCLSGSSAVSKFELTCLPLPDVERVQMRIDQGMRLNEAIKTEYSALKMN